MVAEGIGGGYEEAEKINEIARKNQKLEVETLRRAKDGRIIPVIIRGSTTIVDAYDAMTSERTYKKAVSHDRALMEILRCAGSQFDPEMALLFVEIMKDRLN